MPGDKCRGNKARILKRQLTQPFRARPAGYNARATLHYHLYAGGIICLNRCHVLKVNEVRSVDPEKMCFAEMGFEVRQSQTNEVLLRRRADRDVIVGALYPLNAGHGNWDDAVAVAHKDSRKCPCSS